MDRTLMIISTVMLAMFALELTETKAAAFNPNRTEVGHVSRGLGGSRIDDNIFAPGRCDQVKAQEIYALEVQWKTGHIGLLYACSERNGPVRMRILNDDIFASGKCDQEKALQIYAVEVQWKTGHTEKLYVCSEMPGSVRMRMDTVKIGINSAAQGMDGVKTTISIVNQQDLGVNIGGLGDTKAKNYKIPE